jgi:hypothetical protein
VLGTSAAELRFAHALLSGHEALLCHGQLFHPNSVELAPDVKSDALSDAADNIALRYLSAPDFLADLIRIEPDRQTGFLLRFGQGWHLPEVLFDRPNAKVMIIYGDPLIGFIESLAGVEPLIEDALDQVSLRSFPPTILVKKFKTYEAQFEALKLKVTTMVAGSKPKGKPPGWSWLTELDLDISQCARVDHRGPRLVKPAAGTSWVHSTLARWRDWFVQVETCLGVSLLRHTDRRIWSRLAADLAVLQKNRQLLVHLLLAGGWQEPLRGISMVDGSLHPPSEERGVAVAVAEPVSADLTKKAAADAAPRDAADAIDQVVAGRGRDPVIPVAEPANPAVGRAHTGNGAATAGPSDPLAPVFVFEMQSEPIADPGLPERPTN